MAEETFPLCSATHQPLLSAIPGNPGTSKQTFNKQLNNTGIISEGKKRYLPGVR
jgi:hypothetical protein